MIKWNFFGPIQRTEYKSGSLICLEQVEDIYSYFCYPTNAKAIGFWRKYYVLAFSWAVWGNGFSLQSWILVQMFCLSTGKNLWGILWGLILACGSTLSYWADYLDGQRTNLKNTSKREEAIPQEEQKATLSYLETELEISPIDNPSYDYVKELAIPLTMK